MAAEGVLTQQLKDVDWKRRREAVFRLGYTGDDEWYPTLVEALDDPDPAVRQAAILSLERLGRPELVGELTKPKILAAEDPEVRRTAVAVLGRVGGLQIVDAVAHLLGDPDWTVRNEAIAVVSKLVDEIAEVRVPEAAKALVRMLPIADHDVREKTIRVLGSFGKAAVSVLVEALSVKSELVKSGAAAALGLIRDPTTVPALVRLLSDESKQVRLSAITALGNIPSSRSIGPLIDRLDDCDARVRTAAVDALERIGRAAVIPLIEALAHAHTEVRAAEILRALGRFADDRALLPILNHLGHTYMAVRGAAVDAVVGYGERAVPHLTEMLALNRVPVEPLIEDALANPQKRNRLRTIRAIGELKDSRAVSSLKEIAQEPDREIRGAAEEALRKIGGATWGRASAAKALGFIGSAEAVPALIKQLSDPNATVRLRVVRALSAIGDVRASKPLAKLLTVEVDHEVRREIVAALGTRGLASSAAVDACVRALSDESRDVRSSAARSLGRLASPKGALPLVRALGDDYWSVRRDAENSLMNIGRRAVPELIAALESRKFTVRLRAARALGAVGDRRALRPLSRLAKRARDERVRRAAEEALSEIGNG